MSRPANGTRIAAHLLVGAAAALLAPKLFSKSAAPLCALLAIAAHEALDAPVARAMAARGIQL